jgi:hypothetical protein
MWQTVRERVAHALGRFADHEAQFKASTVEHLVELTVLVPGWNLAKDPRAEEAVALLGHALQGVDAKEIRKNASLRTSTAERLRALLERLDEWGVGLEG